MLYTSPAKYLESLMDLLGTYGIDRKDVDALSLVGFNTHVLGEMNETVQYVSRYAINESQVITANRLDSLYKHAREVDLFPTLSRPARLNMIFLIDARDFDEKATVSGNTKRYVINKTNTVRVGDFIYSLDYDIEISAEITDSIDDAGYVTARYLYENDKETLPDILQDLVNPVIKIVKKKTIRGWEYQLYLTLKQYAREIHEREFQDRDYSAFHYTASAELIAVKSFRKRVDDLSGSLEPLKVRLYFENSRTSEDSVYLQFESPNSFTIVHKSQENGFRPKRGDKIVNYIYTTAGEKANFRINVVVDEDIVFIPDDETDLGVLVALPDGGLSYGGVSYTNDKETLRKEIITRRSTRDAILTENDLMLQINNLTRNNEHNIIKTRNDIRRIFNVFTTLKYKAPNGKLYYIPTNTLDIEWDFEKHASVDTVVREDGETIDFYNLTSFIVKCTGEPDKYGEGELISPTVMDLATPLMEEYRLGVDAPVFTTDNQAIYLDEENQIPTINKTTERIVEGVKYYYDDRILKALRTKENLKTGEAILLAASNDEDTDGSNDKEIENLTKELNHLQGEYDKMPEPEEGDEEAKKAKADKLAEIEDIKVRIKNLGPLFDLDTDLYYYLPYYMVYARSKYKNYIQMYEQTVDSKYNLDYNLVDKRAKYSFICNWIHFDKSSLLNTYKVNINVRNSLAGTTLVDNNIIHRLGDGTVLDLNKLQVFLILRDKEDKIVYSNRFYMDSYEAIPSMNDDYINYNINILPGNMVPKIIDGKITLWSDLHQEWFVVPVSGLRAQVRVYNIDTFNDNYSLIGEGLIERRMKIDPKKPGDPPIYIPIYKTLNYLSDAFLVNYYEADVDILKDLTAAYKIQHAAIKPTVNRIRQIPLVQYTFYKYFANLYHDAIQEDLQLLSLVAEQIANYVDSIDFMNYDNFHISKLYDKLYDVFRNDIGFIEFKSMNGKLLDNQLLQMNTDVFENNTIIEKINIPYRVNKDFKYNIRFNKVANYNLVRKK